MRNSASSCLRPTTTRGSRPRTATLTPIARSASARAARRRWRVVHADLRALRSGGLGTCQSTTSLSRSVRPSRSRKPGPRRTRARYIGYVCKASSRSRVTKVCCTTARSCGKNGNGTTAASVGLTNTARPWSVGLFSAACSASSRRASMCPRALPVSSPARRSMARPASWCSSAASDVVMTAAGVVDRSNDTDGPPSADCNWRSRAQLSTACLSSWPAKPAVRLRQCASRMCQSSSEWKVKSNPQTGQCQVAIAVLLTALSAFQKKTPSP